MRAIRQGQALVSKLLFAGEVHARRAQVFALRRQLEKLKSENAALHKRMPRFLGAIPSPAVDEKIARILAYRDSADVAARIDAHHEAMGPKHYGAVWRQRLDVIRDVVVARGESELSRAVASVRRTEERRRSMGLEERNWVVFDREIKLPARAGAAAYRSAVVETVVDAVTPETTKIIETGSGWGEHLCNVYLEGGPQDATYFALEYEREGRQCAEALAATEPQFKLRSAFFDYTAPDYGAVEQDDGHAILLTAHSIEQVADIDPNTIYLALKLARRVSGIHFEPVGWQTQPETDWSTVTRLHHERCSEKKYNRNLYAILQRAESEGRIHITKVATNFIGLDHNPATLITWEKI